MPLTQNEWAEIQELALLHDQVAAQLKQYEQVLRENPSEVLNELRYALRALMGLLTCEEEDRRLELMQQIRNALYCAYHDLLDGILIELTREMDETAQKYPDAMHKVLGERYHVIIETVDRVEGEIATSRGNIKNRHEIYKDLYDDFPVLLEHLKVFQRRYLPDIVKMADRMEEREKKARRDKQIGWSLGIGGIVIGTIGVVIRFLW